MMASATISVSAPVISRYELHVPVRRVAEPRLPIRLAVGRAIRRLRATNGYSEEQLGARAGLSAVQIVALERGELNASLLTLERVSTALGVRVSDLLRAAEREVM